MFTQPSALSSTKSATARQNEINAGLYALDGETQNTIEVLTGKRLQQKPRPVEPGEPGEPGPGEPAVAPVLASLHPNTAVMGSTDFELRLLGTGFAAGCTIVFNGGDELTTFVSETELTTGVKPSLATVASTVPVAVRNPDDMLSNELPFSFTEPVAGGESAREGAATGRGKDQPKLGETPGRDKDHAAAKDPRRP